MRREVIAEHEWREDREQREKAPKLKRRGTIVAGTGKQKLLANLHQKKTKVQGLDELEDEVKDL